jgi:chlorophyll synthase
MARLSLAAPLARAPSPGAVLELLKPITWFAPVWAYFCGIVSVGGPSGAGSWAAALVGLVLAGPLVCATSQAVNDWYDRDVDAINEPHRPIPSGRVPGRWGFYIACLGTALSALVGLGLGPIVAGAAVAGLLLAWAYSAPPFRLKRSGVWGPLAVGLCYEGLAWFTGAAATSGGMPSGQVLALALLYSLGAHGIMTLNDFKAIEGDRRLGLRSLPVVLGPKTAARVACVVMAAPQLAAAGLLLAWDRPWFAGLLLAGIAAQGLLMARLLRDPQRYAPWYNATGTSLFVLGMLACAVAVSPAMGG